VNKNIEIQVMPISALKNNPRNPRQISDLALSRLQKSVERFGLVEPIVYNKRSGCIVGGHQRVKALKQLGEKEATVVVVDLDETDEKALNIALNSTSLMGEFVQESVDAILQEIHGQNRQLAEDIGFAGRDMDLNMRIKEEYGEVGEKLNEVIKETPHWSDFSGDRPTKEELIEDNPKLVKFLEERERANVRMQDADDPNFWLCLVFQSWDQKQEFLERFPDLVTEYGMYVDGEAFAKAVGVPVIPNMQKPLKVSTEKRLEAMAME